MLTAGVDDTRCAAVRDAVAELRRAQHRLVAAVGEVNDGTLAAESGYKSPRRLVEDLCRVGPGEAKSLIAQSVELLGSTTLTGEPVPAPLPATAAASAAGDVGEEQWRVISTAMATITRIPDLEPAVVTAAEAILAEHAVTLSPVGLAKAAARLIATLDPDGAAPVDEPEPTDELHLARRRRDGALTLAGLAANGADAETIREVFDALSTPAGPDDERSLGQRQMAAFLELCAQALSPTGIATPDPDETDADADADAGEDTDADVEGDAEAEDDADDVGADERGLWDSEAPAATDLPTDAEETGDQTVGDQTAAKPATKTAGQRAGKGCPPLRVLGRALLTVTMDLDWLRAQVGYGTLDSEHTVSPAEARKLACDAGIVPIVLGARSEPLDVGRLSYTVPEGMRRALHHRDGGCSFPGCTRRPKRCHAHHITSWLDLGETELENLTLLCVYHHHLVHHDQWRIDMRDGRPWFTPPRWIDPSRTPRPGGRFPFAG